MKGAELNIEGTALLNNRLYFFNRSNNCFFDYSLRDFNAISKGEIPFYEPRAQFLDLPKLKGIKAGVSGACGIKGNQIIFSASVEDTYNAYDDGEILGSFMGLLVLNKKGELEKMHISAIENLEQKKKVKVESICLHKQLEKNKLEVLLVTDNDGKASTFFKCSVELTN
jgi:hypothetical protein